MEYGGQCSTEHSGHVLLFPSLPTATILGSQGSKEANQLPSRKHLPQTMNQPVHNLQQITYICQGETAFPKPFTGEQEKHAIHLFISFEFEMSWDRCCHLKKTNKQVVLYKFPLKLKEFLLLQSLIFHSIWPVDKEHWGLLRVHVWNLGFYLRLMGLKSAFNQIPESWPQLFLSGH